MSREARRFFVIIEGAQINFNSMHHAARFLGVPTMALKSLAEKGKAIDAVKSPYVNRPVIEVGGYL